MPATMEYKADLLSVTETDFRLGRNSHEPDVV
jgi:hypothetical protein